MRTKKEIRELNKTARSKMSQSEVSAKSTLIAKTFLKSELYKKAQQIMLYMPLGNEVDTKEIIKAAFAAGKAVAFPVTEKTSGVITPYYAALDTLFEKGNFSIMEPKNTAPADVSKLDVVLVPGIAFDKNGNRVVFGKGCYDIFFKEVDAVKVGVCYDFQICEEIPADEHDIKMDFLLTESGLKQCGNSLP